MSDDRHFVAKQEATARWMGYATVAEMNAAHDPLHEALCDWLGISSHSMANARGEDHDSNLAALEEDAIMSLQRFMAHSGVRFP